MADRCYYDNCTNFSEDDCAHCKQPVCRRHSRELANGARVCHSCEDEILDSDDDAGDNYNDSP